MTYWRYSLIFFPFSEMKIIALQITNHSYILILLLLLIYMADTKTVYNILLNLYDLIFWRRKETKCLWNILIIFDFQVLIFLWFWIYLRSFDFCESVISFDYNFVFFYYKLLLRINSNTSIGSWIEYRHCCKIFFPFFFFFEFY